MFDNYSVHIVQVHLYTCILHIDGTLQLNSFQSHLRELQNRVTHQNATVIPYLPHINALLERVCKAAETTSNVAIQPLEKQENILPGKTNELQWRFRKTAKSPGRKKTGLVLRCTTTSMLI